jgi:hypothetical protein
VSINPRAGMHERQGSLQGKAKELSSHTFFFLSKLVFFVVAPTLP